MPKDLTLPRLILVLTAMLLFGQTAIWAQAESRDLESTPAISLSISAVHETVTLGFSVRVKVTMKNITGHKVTYWRENAPDPADHEYTVNVVDAKSVRPPDTKFGQTMRIQHDPKFMPDVPRGARSGGWIPLKPWETIADELNVSKLYDLSSPGRYTCSGGEIRRRQ